MNSAQSAPQMRSDRLIRAGGVLIALGMGLTAVAMSPLLIGGHLPSAWWSLSMITGVGLVVLLIGLRLAGATRSRSVQDLAHRRSN